jgi:uncharacterized protein (TIGR03546 family)
MLIRHFGRMVRGQATPGQIMTGALLGGALGWLPSFGSAPGLCLLLGALILVLNVSVPYTLLVFAAARLLGLLALPLSFQVGRALLDGPTQGLFRAAINAPVLALFGFEHYTTPGSLVLGLLFGALAGWLTLRTVRRLRATLAGLDTGSPKYREMADKPYTRLLGWVFLGSKDLHWSQDVAKKAGPVRLPGVILVAVVLGLLVVLRTALTGPLLTRVMRGGLERANGATVDLQRAELDFTSGRMALEGLALADAAAPERDLFRAARVSANVDLSDLLRKRLALDEVIVSEARQGALREVPGERLGDWPEPPPPQTEGGGKTLEDYVASAEEWKERLQQLQRWLQSLEGGGEEQPGGPTWEDELEQRAAHFGWAAVTADHLVEGAPTFLIRRLVIDGMVAEGLPGEVLDVNGSNLTTQPALAGGPSLLSLKARSDLLEAQVGLGQATGNDLLFRLKGWPVDRFASALSVGGEPPLAGGTLDLLLDGGWAGGRVGQLDLPLKVTLHDTTLHVAGRSQAVKLFRLDLGLRGPLDNPSIFIDDHGLAQSLKEAGAAQLSAAVEEKQAEVLGEAKQKVDEKVNEALGDKLGDLFGGKKDEQAEPKKKKKP